MRNYGRFTTSIWRDPDFVNLTTKQQAVYFMLATQPEVSAAGTLPLTLRRWSSMASDLTPDDLRKVLGELEESAGRHVVIDEDTEELLVRKFIKFDGGMGNEKRRPVVEDAAQAVSSPRIITEIAREIHKLGYVDIAASLWTDSPSDTASDSPSDTAFTGSGDTASDRQCRFDRVVVTKGEYVPQPHPATSGGGTVASDASVGPPSMFCSNHPNGTEQACGACGTAKAAYKAHVAATAGREAEARRAALAAIAACDQCDSKGFQLDPETHKPTSKCDHERRSA